MLLRWNKARVCEFEGLAGARNPEFDMFPSAFWMLIVVLAVLAVLSLAAAARNRKRRLVREEAKPSPSPPPGRRDL
jgi:membrane protein implicated in regulation of membrane protease activity